MFEVSLFAASIRPNLYDSFFESFKDTSVSVEAVFSGHARMCDWIPRQKNHALTYIQTASIKPSQCYEIARKKCVGELVVWCADDCEFKNDVLGKAYRYWKAQGDRKLILSIQTSESFPRSQKPSMMDMNVHRFFGRHADTPLMAPLGMMSREYLEELGGIDRRYVCGQYENDIVMRAYADGGRVEIFGDTEVYIELDHMKKSGVNGTIKEFIDRPFGQGYPIDRKVLEGSWVKNGKVTLQRNDSFEPFEDEDIEFKSQSNNLPGYWK